LEIKSSADFVRMTRAALAAGGFTRHEHDGFVWWTGGADGDEQHAPPLVLIHGVNDQAGTWFPVAPVLAKRFHVIVPDLPGHGESEPKRGPLPLSLMIARLHEIIPAHATLLGNSMGGWLAMYYAIAHPERVERLVLESPGGLSRPLTVPLFTHDHDEALAILRAVHGPSYVAQPWVIDALLERAKDAPMLRLTELAEHLLDTRLHEIRVPTTILWGADDGVVPRDYAEAVHAGIAGSTLHVIDGAAHIPHLQQPERVLQCLSSIF
jgi:pimeloyl-ACP methyl ester carboxylesterase